MSELLPRETVTFWVDGQPLPKQSYRAVKGGGYTDPRVKAWQNTVAVRAIEAMQGREPYKCAVIMQVHFYRANKVRADLDNLNKAVSDAMNGIVFEDDTQAVDLRLIKYVRPRKPGAQVWVYPASYERSDTE